MKILTVVVIWFILLLPQSGLFAQQKIVTAAQVNGTWKSTSGTFKILALGKQRLKVEFSGTYSYDLDDGSQMVNVGVGSGIATITGDTALFKPDDVEEECTITMVFARGSLVVEQEGVCGFGHNVTAEGSYRRVSARKPQFK